MPRAWSLLGEPGVVEVTKPAEGSRRTVKAKLYTGGVVHTRLSGMPFATPFVIDLASLRIPDKPIPMRHEKHDGRVGVWTRIWVEQAERGPEVWGEGYLLSNPDAQLLAQDADEGFPFETSLSANGVPDWLDEGQHAVVNGKEIVGPAVIGRDGLVREASLLTLGADSNTSSAILAEGSDPVMSKTKNTDAPDATAELESVAVEDITPEWLRENKPDLVEALVTAAKEEGAPPAEETAEMAQPATLAELKALGADSDSVIWALEQKLPLAHAKATFEFADRRVAALEGAGAPPQPDRGAPAKTTAELAEEPRAAWEASEPLRNYWKDRGGMAAFLSFCDLSKADRTDWRADIAGELTNL